MNILATPKANNVVDNIVVFIMWFCIFACAISVGIWQNSWSLGCGVFFYLVFRAYKQ